MDQAHMPEIIGHLVDEIGATQGPVGHRICNILFAKLADRIRIQLRQNAGIARVIKIEFAALQFMHDTLDIGQFLCAFNHAVRREDLFNQR